jgi:hypothetical protein
LEALVYLPKGVEYWGQLLGDDDVANNSDGQVEEIITTSTTTTTTPPPTGGQEALFLTASYQGKLVLGARVPMEGIMFPFLAQFYEGNLLIPPSTWEKDAKKQDLVVRARVCAAGTYPPCEKALLRAASLSKFLPEVRDPNVAGEKGEVIATNVRIGASLMLQRPEEATTLEQMRRNAEGGSMGGGVGGR